MSRASWRRRPPGSRRKSEATGTLERSLPPPTKRTFLLLEAHRPASAIALTPKGWRRARRYENLLVAAAVTKLQRDCLALTDDSEWLGRGGKRALLQGVWLSLRRVAPQLEGEARRLSAVARRKAEKRAGTRFDAICASVSAELRSAGELTTAPEPDRCTATTRRGTRCAHPARADGLCAVHHRLATATAPTAIAASGAIARRMEQSAGLLASSTYGRATVRPRARTRGHNLLAGRLDPLRRAMVAATSGPGRLATHLRREIVAHRQTASATAFFTVAAVVLGLAGLPFGGAGSHGGAYPGAGVIGVEGADASAPGLQASAGATRDAAVALASHRRARGSDRRGRGGSSTRRHGHGGLRDGASRLASVRSPSGQASPTGGSNGTTSGSSPAPRPGPTPSPAPSPAPSPSPSPAPSPQPSPSPQPTGTVTHTVNTVRQGASQTVNGVTRTAQGAVGHATSGVGHAVAGIGG